MVVFFCVHSLCSRDGSLVLGLLLPWPSPSLVFHFFFFFQLFLFASPVIPLLIPSVLTLLLPSSPFFFLSFVHMCSAFILSGPETDPGFWDSYFHGPPLPSCFMCFFLFPTFYFCFSCCPSFDPYCSHSSSSLFALYIFPVFCSHVFAFVFSFLHSVPLSFFCDLARFALLHSSSRRLQSSLSANLCELANTFASVKVVPQKKSAPHNLELG